MALHELYTDDDVFRGFRAVVNIPPLPCKKSWRKRKKTFLVADFGTRSVAKTEAEAKAKA